MKEPIRNYMKVGTIVFMSYPQLMKGEGPVEECVRKIALDDYFDVIEVSWIKDEKVRGNVKKLLDESRLQVGYGSQPRLLTTGMNINDLDEEGRRKALDSMLEGIDEAYELGAKGFAYLSGKYEEATKQESFDALLRSTEEMCAYAKSKGNMKILLEVFDFDVDKKSIIGPCALAKQFAEAVRSRHDNFGLLADLSHMPLVRENSRDTLLELKDYIEHIHIGNAVVQEGCEAYGDAHPRFGFPNGSNDVKELVEFLRALMEIGYLSLENPGAVSFEVKPWGEEDADAILAHSKRTLNEAWAML